MFNQVKDKAENYIRMAFIILTVGCMLYGVAMTGQGLWRAKDTAWAYFKQIVTGEFILNHAATHDDESTDH